MATVATAPSAVSESNVATLTGENGSSISKERAGNEKHHQQTHNLSQLEFYTMLVERSLNVQLLDNALWIAERCAAEYPSSPQAIYQLALCHYRCGNFKAARHALEHRIYTGLDDDGNGSHYSIGRKMDYLEALCCYELKDYNYAEECLLRKTRSKFRELQSINNNAHISSFDDWTMYTLTPSNPLIPMGAAGFCLLGKILLSSNRKKRAIRYFRVSLQLDPFLWTSIEALAQLGAYTNSDSNRDNTTTTSAPSQTSGATRTRPTQKTTSKNTKDQLETDNDENQENDRIIHKGPSQAEEDDTLPPFQLSRKSIDGPSSILMDGAGGTRLFGAETPSASFTPMVVAGATNHEEEIDPSSSLLPHFNSNTGRGERDDPIRRNSHNATLTMQTPGLTPIAPTSVSRVHLPGNHAPETPYPPPSGGGAAAAAAGGDWSNNRSSSAMGASSFSFLAPRQTHINTTARTSRGNEHDAITPEQHDDYDGETSNVRMMTLPPPETPRVGGRNSTVEQHEFPMTNSRVDESDHHIRNHMFSSSSMAWNASEQQMRQQKTTTSTEDENFHENQDEKGLSKTVLKQKKRKPVFADASNPVSSTTDKDQTYTNSEANAIAFETVLRLFQTAATFYQQVCQYRCKEALQTLRQFSRRQQETGWVLHQQGRAHLEMNEFAASQRCLELMQAKDPCRLDGLDLLSTVYWHLKKGVELSHLSQRVVAANRLSPVTWCVVGNCFSLQKDHETALVFFRRSLQIDPNCTYIHTLCGYEYMANEDYDKAISCFRQALKVNDRHYNAWYGLGAIFHRQEKFDMAEYHFERAMQLHPTSSILLCNLGIAQYANGKAYHALDTLAQAFALDPQNPQARFQRASIYAALHRPAEALAELLKVRDSAPREAAVHFAMGKVLKRLGRPQEAITSFLTAMDLDPKDNQIIKSAMDKVGEPDVSEESMSTF